MKKFVLPILITFVLLFSFVLPVQAAEGLKSGDKLVLDNGVVAEFLGKTPDGRYQWKAIVGAPQYLDDLVTPIECRWNYDEGKKQHFSEANLFDSIVKGTKVTVEYEGLKLSWEPDVFIGTKKQSPLFSTAQLIFTDPINENYYGNTLQWTYGDITRDLRIIEGMLIEYYTINSMPTDDILIIPHTTKDLGFIWSRPSEAWDAEGEPLGLLVGKDGELTLTLETMSRAVFPITVDPDTTFYTSASDGKAGYGAGSWSSARTVASGSIYDTWTFSHIATGETAGGWWYVNRSFLYFDTSPIPDDATIDDAELYLYIDDIVDDDDAEFYIVEGMPTYPHDPLVGGDYLYTHYTFGTEYGYVDASEQLAEEQYEKINYSNSTALKGIVSKTGYTKLCLIERRDKVNEEPAAYEENELTFYTYEKGEGYRPKLEVTYSSSAAPTVTTDAASNVAKTTARLNSTLVDDGGGLCRYRFGYGTTTQATIDAYDSQTTWSEYIYNSGEHPYADIGSLVDNTPYFFRVQMQNDTGPTTGSELTFTTEADISDPSDFRGYPQSTSISLSWTPGIGYTQSLVRFAYDDFPDTTTDGTQVYLGASSTYTHAGLTPGKTYYYSVWGESGGEYSAGYDTAMVTTSAAEAAGEEFETPVTPLGWMQAPDPTAMENIEPLYTMVNNLANSYSIPLGSFWFILAVLISMGLAVAVYTVSHEILAGTLVLAAAMAFFVFQGLMPSWIIFIAVLFNVVVIIRRRKTA